MATYTHRFRVNTSLDRVLEFHQDPRALKWLTPPPVIVQFHDFEPVAENSRVDFTMWMGPLPVRWVAIHSEVDPNAGFTDSQVHGPFKRWVHRHNFRRIDAQVTEIEDTIEAEPGSHPVWGLVSRFMWSNLGMLFKYRERVTRRKLESPAAN